ncbi:hypothetical protein X975_07143, partial [Stegodyphus mimosarum]
MPRYRIRAHCKQLSEFERGRIIGLKEAGWANRRIARHMSRSDAAIRRCWQEWVYNGRFQRHDGSCRPRSTTNREDRLIVRSAVTAPDSSLTKIRRATRTRVSTMTIHRRLIERNLRSCRPLSHLTLTPVHCQPRLQWCLDRSGWNDADWGRIVFSGEACFQLGRDYHRRRVWSHTERRADPAFTTARHTGPQIMDRDVISFDIRTPLVFIRGKLTAQRITGDEESQSPNRGGNELPPPPFSSGTTMKSLELFRYQS